LLRGALARIAALAVGQAQSESIDPLQELSIRIDTLRDLSADAKTFNAFYSVDRLKDQPHFMRCLEILEGERGEFSRGALLRALRLKEANGTRVLKTLEAARLIKRERQGQGVMVRLTPEGRKALLSWRSPNLDPALAENVFLYVKEREIPGVARRRWGASR
jgi:DNA-binding MarR family transcriptional regulator